MIQKFNKPDLLTRLREGLKLSECEIYIAKGKLEENEIIKTSTDFTPIFPYFENIGVNEKNSPEFSDEDIIKVVDYEDKFLGVEATGEIRVRKPNSLFLDLVEKDLRNQIISLLVLPLSNTGLGLIINGVKLVCQYQGKGNSEERSKVILKYKQRIFSRSDFYRIFVYDRIEMDSFPVLSISVTKEAPEELQGSVVFTISSHKPVENDLIIDLVISGTALSGVDFVSPSSNQATILSDQKTVLFPIQLLDDNEMDGDKELTVSISSSEEYSVLQRHATVKLIDNDVIVSSNISNLIIVNNMFNHHPVIESAVLSNIQISHKLLDSFKDISTIVLSNPLIEQKLYDHNNLENLSSFNIQISSVIE